MKRVKTNTFKSKNEDYLLWSLTMTETSQIYQKTPISLRPCFHSFDQDLCHSPRPLSLLLLECDSYL